MTTKLAPRLILPDGKKINGIMALQLRPGRYFNVIGGPFSCRPANTFGVKLAKEIILPCDLDIPSEDFGTPSMKVMVAGIEKAVRAILQGQLLYAGCMGGIGRTGLFMACLAKTFGHVPAVEYVRKTYLSHAVETSGQKAMILQFEPSKRTLAMIRWAALKSYVGLQPGLSDQPMVYEKV